MAILVCQPAIGLLSLSLKPAKGSSGLCRMLGNAMQWQPCQCAWSASVNAHAACCLAGKPLKVEPVPASGMKGGPFYSEMLLAE